ESTSLATASRKNMKRKSEEKRKMGRRGDWIFLKEAGLKLPKVLKDMLVKLMKKVDWNREKCAKMQIVGIIHAGLMIMTVHLDNPQGYVCRIRRGETVIKETLKVIQASEQTIESFKTAGRRKRPRDINQRELSGCISTPKKAKNEKACAEVNDERPDPESPCPGSP
ncbi:16276_t:CDS:2, partial [Racocetra persica]